MNVEVFLHRDGRWLLIKRGDSESQAPGVLAGVGGKVDAPTCDVADIIEVTARREVREEIGVDLGGVVFGYAESAFFLTDDGDPVVNITLTAPLPAEAAPFPAAADEVAGIAWLTLDEALADPRCPPWTRRSLERAAGLS